MPEVVAPSPAKAKAKPQGLAAAVAAGLSNMSGPETQADEYADMLKAVPQLAALGPVFKTCSPVQVRARGGRAGGGAWRAGLAGQLDARCRLGGHRCRVTTPASSATNPLPCVCLPACPPATSACS